VPVSAGETSKVMNSKLNTSKGKRNKLFQNGARAVVSFKTVALFDVFLTVHHELTIQGVTGGTDQTSGGCSLC
jgi:hypothetical protein